MSEKKNKTPLIPTILYTIGDIELEKIVKKELESNADDKKTEDEQEKAVAENILE